MKQYHIFHSTGTNRFEEVEIQPREYAGFVQANSIEEVFKKSQNGFSNSSHETAEFWNPTNPCRSTCVGDVIQDYDKFYLICGRGFKLVKELTEVDYYDGMNLIDLLNNLDDITVKILGHNIPNISLAYKQKNCTTPINKM